MGFEQASYGGFVFLCAFDHVSEEYSSSFDELFDSEGVICDANLNFSETPFQEQDFSFFNFGEGDTAAHVVDLWYRRARNGTEG